MIRRNADTSLLKNSFYSWYIILVSVYCVGLTYFSCFFKKDRKRTERSLKSQRTRKDEALGSRGCVRRVVSSDIKNTLTLSCQDPGVITTKDILILKSVCFYPMNHKSWGCIICFSIHTPNDILLSSIGICLKFMYITWTNIFVKYVYLLYILLFSWISLRIKSVYLSSFYHES